MDEAYATELRKPLTRRQNDVLAVIRSAIRRRNIAPTLAELCRELGTSSKGSMVKHLQNLQRRGLIEYGGGSRRIVLKDCCPYCGRRNDD